MDGRIKVTDSCSLESLSEDEEPRTNMTMLASIVNNESSCELKSVVKKTIIDKSQDSINPRKSNNNVRNLLLS